MQAFGRYNGGVMVDEQLLTRLSEVKPRTLIVMAPKDELIPATTGHVLKEKIPLSHLTYMYDAAHGIENDQPERMLRLVTSFLERGEAFIVNTGRRKMLCLVEDITKRLSRGWRAATIAQPRRLIRNALS